MKLKRIFLLTSKKLLLIPVSWVVAVLLHNIVLAATWLGLFTYNATLEPMRFSDILLWMIFAACPLAGGIMFIRLGKRKREAPQI